MNSQILKLAAYLLLLSAMSASAAIRYVDVNSASPTPPYTNWTAAATTIQDAVDAAVAGDQILVTNGVYQSGGRVMFGAMTNRVAVNKPVTVQSVNGAAVTEIQGFQVPGTTNGNTAIRCVYLTNGAALVGFTLTNGATRRFGDGDYEREQSGGGVWCESTNAVLSNCVVSGNSASYDGGGAVGGTLNNCTLTANSAYSLGGGAYLGTLNNCTLRGNSAQQGGGVSDGVLHNCTLSGNLARAGAGGGALAGTLNNCTLTANSAIIGGGAGDATLNNCIVYYNSARIGDDNYSGSVLNYSCTTPLPPEGTGNISTEPQLVDLSHLSAGSPCRGAGSVVYTTGPDIDGESWANPPSIGCDEYHPRAVTGPLSASIHAVFTNVILGFAVNFTVAIDGHATANQWDFGDGTVVGNRLAALHSWAVAGDYSVVFRAYNDTYPDGVSATVTVRVVSQPVHYVALGSVNPVAPYTSWATAATNIQDAVDAVLAAGALVLVTNGVYQTGGRVASEATAITNRVAVTKPLMLRSVNGAAVTLIQGYGDPDRNNPNYFSAGVRCVYLANGAELVGFTLTNGTAHDGGAGVRCESRGAVVSNCVLTGNRANGYFRGGGAVGGTLNNCTITGNSASYGGGASDCTLNNCVLTGNSSPESAGGGASDCTLNNCTITGNSASYGGGAYSCTGNNCIIYYNSAANRDNYSLCDLSYSCTTPLPPEGVGNTGAEPQLADLFHLSAGSPCRGAASLAYVTGLDIDGEPWTTPPSMGCDEFHPGAVPGPLSASIQAAWTNVSMGFAVNFAAALEGHAAANRWDFGDGTVVSNRLAVSHSWAEAGDYSVVFRAYNDTYPAGVSATVTVHVVAQPIHYVALGSRKPVAPYTSWATAAANIQDAVDAASLSGALVLVTNGVYQTGERGASEEQPTPNRVAVTKALTVRSINGAAVTVINGKSVVRCVYLTNGAALVGFTLTNGNADSGGGALCDPGAVVSNCVLVGNEATLYGGGARGGTLNNCALTGNAAKDGNYGSGGGAFYSTLNNCTLTGNSSAGEGGAASGGTLNNCILYYNSARSEDNYSDSLLSYSCTTPLPSGIGNLTNAPLFVDSVGGNLRLQSNSPCINAGANTFAPAGFDLDGDSRIIGGTVDIGAYEFQFPQSPISYAWLQQYGLRFDGSEDRSDPDGDGLNNWQEWHTGTNPTNALSTLRLLSPARSASGLIISWNSAAGLNYFLERSTNLEAQPPFLPLAANIAGQPGTTTFIDTNAVGVGPFFYRVGVQE